jgi:alanine racemase
MKSWIEISKERLVANLRAVQAVAGEAVEVLAVVKANGYGHDAAVVAQALVEGGARWLGVTDVEEGARLRRSLTPAGTRLLVMSGMEPADAEEIVAQGLTPVVWTLEHVDALEKAAQASGHRVRVHLEVDTGMSRQGATPGADLAAVAVRLAASDWVVCEGVMTHLACSEAGAGTAGSTFTAAQKQWFGAALEQVQAAGIEPELVHIGNTSAVDEGSTMAWICEAAVRMGAKAMVRTGLAIYGDALPLEGESRAALHPKLAPVLTWKTRVIALREIAAGTTVGYGATFTAQAPMRLALLPVGYADGFRREASSGVGDGWVVIAGQRAKVVGRVSMNLTVVDVTGLAVVVGDAVVLLGEGVSADDHARWCGTIPYEILCGARGHIHLV